MKKLLFFKILIAFVTLCVSAQSPAFQRTISVTNPRMNGEDVYLLQERLLDLGYEELIEADGWFGPNTEKAVKRFQDEHDIFPTGIVEQITWHRIFTDEVIISARYIFESGILSNYDLTGENVGIWNGHFISKDFSGETIHESNSNLPFGKNIRIFIIVPDAIILENDADQLTLRIYKNRTIYKEFFQDDIDTVRENITDIQLEWSPNQTVIYSQDIIDNPCTPLDIELLVNDKLMTTDQIIMICRE